MQTEKKSLLVAVSLATAILCSCSGDKKQVADFRIEAEFATKVAAMERHKSGHAVAINPESVARHADYRYPSAAIAKVCVLRGTMYLCPFFI